MLGEQRAATQEQPAVQNLNVLGVRRNAGQDSPEVLGSRRGQTGEDPVAGRVLMILFALVVMTGLIGEERKRLHR